MSKLATVSGSAAAAPTPLKTGDIVSGQYKIGQLLGKGGFGAVYECIDEKSNEKYAIKIELKKPKEGMPGLNLETSVLKRVQNNKHFVRYVHSGKHGEVSFLIMTLVGRNLSDLRKCCPNKAFTVSTGARLALQCFEAIQGMHNVGLLHRDVKPGNFAIGIKKEDCRNVYLLDFGLVRRFTQKDGTMRPARKSAAFRGTRRYASPNALNCVEVGRHDDLIGWLYSIIELLKGTLPFPNETDRKKMAKIKEASKDELFKDIDPIWRNLYDSFMALKYKDEPPYKDYEKQMNDYMQSQKIKQDDPFDWEQGGKYHEAVQKTPVKRTHTTQSKRSAYLEDRSEAFVSDK